MWEKNKALFWFLHSSHGWWNTADDYRYDCNTKDDNRDSKLQLTSTIWSSATVWVAWVPNRSQIQVMVMAVYSPGNVEISTTISIGVIGVRVCPIEYLLFLSFFATKKTQVLRWWWWWSSSTFGSALCPFTRAWKRSRTLGLTRCQCQEKGDCHCYIICIPHIFPYWYTTALFRPIKVHQKVRKFATK